MTITGSRKLEPEKRLLDDGLTLQHLLSSISILFFSGLGPEVSLLCSSCNENFLHPWDLLIHVQKTHSLQIFEESDEQIGSESSIINNEDSSGATRDSIAV